MVKAAPAQQINQDMGNALMEWFATEYATRNWRNVLKNTKGGVGAIEAIEAALADIGTNAPAAIMVGGTGALKDRYDFGNASGETIQGTIAGLKSAGRLVQLGQGRGYALVLLESKPLGTDVEGTPQITQGAPAKAPGRTRAIAPVMTDNPLLALEQVTAAIKSYQDTIAALETENARLRADLVTAGADTWN